MIKLDEAMRGGLVSSRFYRIVPHKCKCGSQLVLSDDLRTLRCTNEECTVAVENRCCRFLKYFGAQVNEDDIHKIVAKLHLISPYQLCDLCDANEAGLISGEDVRNLDYYTQFINNLAKTEVEIYQVIESCGVENIMAVAKGLFYGFNSIEEIYNELDTCKATFINERLGIVGSDSTALSVEIYNKFMSMKEEFLFAETVLRVRRYRPRLTIAFSDNDFGKDAINRSEVMEILSNDYDITFLHVAGVNENTDILVRGSSNGGARLRAAHTINEVFKANGVNSGKFELEHVGDIVEGQLKPVGSQVYIDSLENITGRLDELYSKE